MYALANHLLKLFVLPFYLSMEGKVLYCRSTPLIRFVGEPKKWFPHLHHKIILIFHIFWIIKRAFSTFTVFFSLFLEWHYQISIFFLVLTMNKKTNSSPTQIAYKLGWKSKKMWGNFRGHWFWMSKEIFIFKRLKKIELDFLFIYKKIKENLQKQKISQQEPILELQAFFILKSFKFYP